MQMVPSHKLGAQNKKRKTAEWQYACPPLLIRWELKGGSSPHTHAILIFSAKHMGPSDYGLNCLKTWAEICPSSLVYNRCFHYTKQTIKHNNIYAIERVDRDNEHCMQSLGLLIIASLPAAPFSLCPSAPHLPLAPSLLHPHSVLCFYEFNWFRWQVQLRACGV